MEANTLYIEDEMSSIVSNIRDTSNILSFSDNSDDTYTLTVSDLKGLSNNDYITISDTINFNENNYEITNINSNTKTFDIKLTSGFPTETGTYTANAPYFKFGHSIEIKNQLNEQAKTNTYKYQRYPLIILFEDIEETKFQQVDVYSDVNLFMAIAMETKRTYTTQQRLTNIFKPTLIPIYNKLINELRFGQNTSYKFKFTPERLVPHTKKNKYFWGSLPSSQNILDAYADAIEINNLKLTFKNRFAECSI